MCFAQNEGDLCTSLDSEDHGHGLADLDDAADLGGPGSLAHLEFDKVTDK